MPIICVWAHYIVPTCIAITTNNQWPSINVVARELYILLHMIWFEDNILLHRDNISEDVHFIRRVVFIDDTVMKYIEASPNALEEIFQTAVHFSRVLECQNSIIGIPCNFQLSQIKSRNCGKIESKMQIFENWVLVWGLWLGSKSVTWMVPWQWRGLWS